MRTLLCNHVLKLKLRQRSMQCYVWSALLYGAEAWTLKDWRLWNYSFTEEYTWFPGLNT